MRWCCLSFDNGTKQHILVKFEKVTNFRLHYESYVILTKKDISIVDKDISKSKKYYVKICSKLDFVLVFPTCLERMANLYYQI